MAAVRTASARRGRGPVPAVRRPPTVVEVAPAFGDGTHLEGCDVLALTVGRAEGAGGPVPDDAAAAATARYGIDLGAVLVAEKVSGRAGELVRIPVLRDGLPERLLLLGTGSGAPSDLRRAGAALGRGTRGRRRLVTSLGAGSGDEGTRAVIEGLLLGGYTPPAIGARSRDDAAPVAAAALAGRHRDEAVARGLAHATATWTARDLAATPSNIKNPQWLVDRALEAALDAGLDVEVWDEVRLAAEGFGGLLAVGGGSATPPRLVRLEHAPGDSRRGPVVLVGKGITFDTGGLSIKPREAMVPMKTDMSGAAAVLATLAACRGLGVRRRVVGLLPLAENAVSGTSYRPGDVVRHYGGRTVEVVNTDAEGRMVLADALAYADAGPRPRRRRRRRDAHRRRDPRARPAARGALRDRRQARRRSGRRRRGQR